MNLGYHRYKHYTNMIKNKSTTNWGFDVRNLDKAVRPQDDFFRFANGGWIKKNKIPAEESRWGSFITLRYNTEKQLHDIVDGLLKKTGKNGSPEQLIGDMYRSALDMTRRNALGSAPLAPWQTKIHAISTRHDLGVMLMHLHRAGVGAPWDFGVDQDSKNSEKMILHLGQSGLGMPERDYYLSDSVEHTRVRDAYTVHIVKMLKLAGVSSVETIHMRDVIMRLETRLAKASMNKEDSRDAEKTYHKRSISSLTKEYFAFDWRGYFSALSIETLREVIVLQPLFFKEVNSMLEKESLEDWKVYLQWHLILSNASLLSDAFVTAMFAFYGTILTGTKKMRAPWRRALGSVNGTLGEALGLLYVQKHFPAESKRRMDILVKDVLAAYERRILSREWMSPTTKRKAVQKLHVMKCKIGYPTRFEQYKGLAILPDDYFGNITRVHEFAHKKHMRKLTKPVDRAQWFMTPQTVNAYCSFNLNEIVFPAAILQTPFFDKDADDAVNYGALGAVIGHEISHGFDDQGSKFDGKGNMKEWWTPEDKKRFTQKAKRLVEQFNQYEVEPGVNVNGQLTLGENIADLGGITIAFDAYQARLQKTGRKDIAGFTPEQRFFLGAAQAEQEIRRPEAAKMAALTDPHAAAPLRVNGPMSNLQSFYDAFSVKKGDKLCE